MRTRRLLGPVVLLCALLPVRAAHAACGDGVVDAGEHCDHGAANGTDGCCAADCVLLDRDLDALCDAADGCDQFALGAPIKEPFLDVHGLATPPSDDVLRFRGRTTLRATPAVDPATQGMRVTLSDSPGDGFAEGVRVLDALLPPGAGWTRRGDRWTYRDRTGGVGGITRAAVKLRPPVVPTTKLVDVVFAVEGRRGAYPVTPAMTTAELDPVTGLPVGRALLAQAAFVAPSLPSNPQCGAVYMTTLLATRCAFSAGGAVHCEGPPIGGPCRLGDPDDLVICDVLSAVRGQARWRERRSTHFTGACDALPGVVPSPGVVCTTSGTDDRFLVSAAHPSAFRSCVWDGAARDAEQPLVCF